MKISGLSGSILGDIQHPVRNQAKQAGHRFALWHRLITNICFPGSANESGWIAWPNIVLAHVNGRHNAEVFGVALALLDSLVVTAHILIVASSLSPQTVPNAVDNCRNKTRKLR